MVIREKSIWFVMMKTKRCPNTKKNLETKFLSSQKTKLENPLIWLTRFIQKREL